ncbi:hypothetical protein [Thalassobaculum sp.]|uniref:hypothetical protein n=1 Tax=Thalassobaculum sp. TaxID=2022740 RepID=UPI0032EB7CF8
MTGPFRAAAGAAAVSVLLLLGGCLTVPAVLAVSGALVAATDAYCGSITLDARQALRDRLTSGRAIIHCVMEDH